MKFYVAPLEGITGYIWRNAHHHYFPGADKYYIPFIEPKPNSRKIFNARELNDVLPEHNQGYTVVPQILTNKADDFIWTARHLIEDYGYTELNINLGCPSKTVASKNRGSGFLAFPDQVDEFLDRIFNAIDVKISVKTRIGRYDAEEFNHLLHIYNQYPLEELIIHPRTQQDFYKGAPRMESFDYAVEHAQAPLCYNGDIWTIDDFDKVKEHWPMGSCYMFGRGVLLNAGLISMLQTGTAPEKKTYRAYHDEIYQGYKDVLFGDKSVLYKMKELWCYMIYLFKDTGNYGKHIKKASNLKEFDAAVEAIFADCELDFHQRLLFLMK